MFVLFFRIKRKGQISINNLGFENRLGIRKFLKKVAGKGKVVVVSTTLGVLIFFSGIETAYGMGLSPMPQIPIPIMRSHSAIDSTKVVPSNVKLNFQKPDKIKPRELPLCIYMMDEQFLRTPKISKFIKELRGGSLTISLIGNVVFLVVLYGIWILGLSEGFVTPQQNPGWGLPNGLYDPPGLVRPVDCGTQLHAGSPTQSLRTWEDRNFPNPKDRWILVESRPKLVIRYGQGKFKTKDHGALAGLPYTIKANGGTSTLKTEENVDVFMDVVEEVVENPKSFWFEEGTYQGGTDREIESINIYNRKHNRLAIFLRSTGEFISFCEPDRYEIKELEETANFGGGRDWWSGRAKNVPSQQEFVSDFTPVNSFERDVMEITPITSIDENSSPNQGFTPLNSFESDVLGITPIDPDCYI